MLPASPRPRILRISLGVVLLGVGVLAAASGFHLFIGNNLHEVVPGRIYRCAQQSPEDLAAIIRKHGIRTVINLRGACPNCDWYLDESRCLHRLNVAQEDLHFSAGRYPPTSEMLRLLEVFDRCEYPVLLHCRRGADRTGIACTAALLLKPGCSFDQAVAQLSPRYGHLAIGRTANLDDYIQLYADWLKQRGQAHTPEQFRAWLNQDNCPGRFRARLELLDKPVVTAGQPFSLRVRAHNIGIDAWQLKPSFGMVLMYIVFNRAGEKLYSEGAGLFEAVVPPGDSIELNLAFPPLPPGAHRLFADMTDTKMVFFQAGSEPIELTLHVVEPGAESQADRLVNQTP